MYKFEGEENEVDEGVEKIIDWVEYMKISRKLRLEKEINFLKNIDLINYNLKLLVTFFENINMYKKYLENFKKNSINKNIFNKSKNSRLFDFFYFYINFNYIKIKKIKNNDVYSKSENLILILDIRPTKPRFFALNKNKCIFSITSGSIYKKLNLKKKSIKKTNKMLNLMIKTSYLKLSQDVKFKKCILHIKGTRFNLHNTILLVNRHFKDKKVTIVYSPCISFSKFKFRKVKAIKRKLKKRISKLVRN